MCSVFWVTYLRTRNTDIQIYQKHSHYTIKQPRENKVYVMLAVYVNGHVNKQGLNAGLLSTLNWWLVVSMEDHDCQNYKPVQNEINDSIYMTCYINICLQTHRN